MEKTSGDDLDLLIAEEVASDPVYKGLQEAADTLSAAASRASEARTTYFGFLFELLKAEALKVK